MAIVKIYPELLCCGTANCTNGALNIYAIVRATEISTVVTITTIRTNWSLECWNKFRVAVKTFQTYDLYS
jgi:hypothetical protein